MKHVLMLLIGMAVVSAATAETTLWKLDADGVDFYIGGSCHALKASDYPLPEEFELAYSDADQVVFETDVRELVSPMVQARLLEMGQYPEGESLADHVSEESYAELEAYCTENELPLGRLTQLKPFFLVMSLAAVEMQKLGIGFQDGLDLYFVTKAKGDGKPILGLETTDEHIQILTAFDDSLNDALIGKFVNEMEEIGPVLEGLLAAWRAGDEEKIDEFISKDLRDEYPELYKKIIVNRNKNWIAPIEALIAGGTNTMVVVGCGHLAGADSVIAMLEDKGYKFDKYKVPEASSESGDGPAVAMPGDAEPAAAAPQESSETPPAAPEKKKVILERL
jgi:uncharacterized protein YbaP (TraB family)